PSGSASSPTSCGSTVARTSSRWKCSSCVIALADDVALRRPTAGDFTHCMGDYPPSRTAVTYNTIVAPSARRPTRNANRRAVAISRRARASPWRCTMRRACDGERRVRLWSARYATCFHDPRAAASRSAQRPRGVAGIAGADRADRARRGRGSADPAARERDGIRRGGCPAEAAYDEEKRGPFHGTADVLRIVLEYRF